MIPVDFLQNDDGDLDTSTGTLRLTPDLVTYTRQALSVNLAVFLGEWYLDERQGIPMFRDLIGEQYDPGLARAIYAQAIRKTRGVGSTGLVDVSFDTATRALSVDAPNVVTTDGDPVDPGPLLIQV